MADDDQSAPDAEALEPGVEGPPAEKERLEEAAAERKPDKGPRWRRITSWVLVVLACLLAVVSVFVVFARNQLLNTDAYVSTMAPLATNPAIQTQVATRVSQELIARTDLQARVKSALPAKAGFLVTPITDEVQNATYSITLKLVQSPKFEQLWVTANRASHKQLVAVLTGTQQGAVSTKDGRITIDLGKVEATVKKDLDAKGITVFDKVPAVKGLNYVLFQSNDLVRIQKLVKFLDKLAVVLPIITLLCFAGAVVLARNRRRGLVRVGVGLALSMGLILVVIAVARNQYLSGLQPPQSPQAAAAVIDTVTANLRDAVRLILILAALLAIGALIAGNSWIRAKVGARGKPGRATGPVHDFVAAHRKALQWGVLALGLVILVIWSNPTTLVAVVVTVITLALVGAVGLFGRGPRPTTVGPAGSGPEIGTRGRHRGVSAPERSRGRPAARDWWRVIEPVHAVTYFAPESLEALRATGLRGFWMGYFAARVAPVGAVGPSTVAATFFNFHPLMIERSVPDAWSFADPLAVLAARRTGAGPGAAPAGSLGRRAGWASRPPAVTGGGGSRRLGSCAVQRQPGARRPGGSGGAAVAGVHLPARAPGGRARGRPDGSRPRRLRGTGALRPVRGPSRLPVPGRPGLVGRRVGRGPGPSRPVATWWRATGSRPPAGPSGRSSRRPPTVWPTGRSPN